jgi:hypothetical protein
VNPRVLIAKWQGGRGEERPGSIRQSKLVADYIANHLVFQIFSRRRLYFGAAHSLLKFREQPEIRVCYGNYVLSDQYTVRSE